MVTILDDSIIGEREKFLGYGDFGTGKTHAGGTMPGTVYFQVFGGDNELKTLRSPSFLNMHPEAMEGKIIFDEIREPLGRRGLFTHANAYDLACDKLDEVLELERKGDVPHIDSIVCDAATGLIDVAVHKVIEYTQGSALDRYKQTGGILILEDRDWGAEQSLVEKYVNWLFDLDKHFLLLTHEYKVTKRPRGSRDEELVSAMPAFTGKHRVDIPKMFDNVWRFTVTGGERGRLYEVQTVGDEVVAAKTRMGGVIPPKIRDVNFTKVIEQFKGATANRQTS